LEPEWRPGIFIGMGTNQKGEKPGVGGEGTVFE